MGAPDGIKRTFPCTYNDCGYSFDTMRQMIRHKKDTQLHDYCKQCDQDFDSYEEYARHKAFRPDNHNKACRVCGDEFKSMSGLKRHIDLNHKVDQHLKCIGCEGLFARASSMVEHLEFGHCPVIGAKQFQSHIVHKHLITDLLKSGAMLAAFMAKMQTGESIDDYEDGGVAVGGAIEEEDDDAKDVGFEAIKPAVDEEALLKQSPFPPLPYPASSSQPAKKLTVEHVPALVDDMTLKDAARRNAGGSVTDAGGSVADTQDEKSSIVRREPKAWKGKSGNQLFPDAPPTPPLSEWSVGAYKKEPEAPQGINMLKQRFWDPLSDDWSPERFYNAVISKYFCPFPCDQQFENAQDMHTHIINEHRVNRINCPSCLRYYQSCTALVAHCESRGSKCTINKADDFNIFLDKITGGFLSVTEKIRPDHVNNPIVYIKNAEKNKAEEYSAPVVTYFKYKTTKPVSWKEPEKLAAVIGEGGGDTFEYQGNRARWGA